MNVSFRLRNLVKDAQCLNLHRLAQVRVIDDRFDLLQVAPVVMVVMMRRGGQVIVVVIMLSQMIMMVIVFSKLVVIVMVVIVGLNLLRGETLIRVVVRIVQHNAEQLPADCGPGRLLQRQVITGHV